MLEPGADTGISLFDTTFVVVDLETTGGSPRQDAITEIGALKLRGGELLGTFATLVNPGVPIPPFISVLTGITESMVLPAPRIDTVLPAFLEFAHGAVLVGHNVRFDVSFLDAALTAAGYPRLAHPRVDTFAIARRLVRDEVPDLKLRTLAHHFHAGVEPVHRAFADASATADLMHALFERAAGYGVFGLDDLLALPRVRAPQSPEKLMLTARLPRTPGVFALRDHAGDALLVGKARNLRACVRGYFAAPAGRALPEVLRRLASVEHRECASAFEAEIRALRLIHALRPRFNRQTRDHHRPVYLRLRPRPAVTRAPASGQLCVGPFASARAARATLAAPSAFRRALAQHRLFALYRHAPRVLVEGSRGSVEVHHGRVLFDDTDRNCVRAVDPSLPPTRAEADELLAVDRWRARTGARVRVLSA